MDQRLVEAGKMSILGGIIFITVAMLAKATK